MLMTMKNMQQQAQELKKLFALSRDAVVGVHGDRVLFANAAAVRLFGVETEGQALSSLLSGQLDVPGEDSYVTAAFLGEDRYTVIAARQGEILVLTLLPGRNAAAGLTAGALSRLRSSAFGLQVALDALVRSQDDPELSRLAYHSYYSLVHSIDQLADASALGRDEFLCRKNTLDLAVLVRDLTDSAAVLVRDRAVEIGCSVPEEPCPVSGDRERLEQMVLILLSNALLHTPAGGRITVGLLPWAS